MGFRGLPWFVIALLHLAVLVMASGAVPMALFAKAYHGLP